MSRVLLRIFLKGDKACERGDQRADAADINTEKKLPVIISKLRKKYRRGDVAYDLAGNSGKYEGVKIKKVGEEFSDSLDPRHISRKNEEENEG